MEACPNPKRSLEAALGRIPRIDERTDPHDIDLRTGCEPALNRLAVFRCNATSPFASDEDIPLRIPPPTTTQQSMRFDGLADERIHHGIKCLVGEVLRNLEMYLAPQFLKFTHV